jgi:two-component system, NtrC family, sensor kinase
MVFIYLIYFIRYSEQILFRFSNHYINRLFWMIFLKRIKDKLIFRLQSKLMLIFLMVALVPITAVGVFSTKTTEQLIVNMVMRQLENVAVDKVAILERWLSERKADMLVIAGTTIVKSLDPEVIAPYLDLIQKNYGVYKKHTVISADGKIAFSFYGGKIIPEDKIGGLHENLYLSNISFPIKDDESAFYIAAPIHDDDGRIKGTIYGTVGTSKIIYFILKVSLGETGECYLVDKEGTFLAHKEPGRILAENISQSDSFKNIFGQRDRYKTYLDYRGIEVLGTFQKVEGTDWYIVVEQDRDEAFQSFDALKRYIYLTILLCIGSAFMLTGVISYHIVSPIRKLSRSADILANSEFEKAIVNSNREDEIGMLYRAFENMAVKIRERQNHLAEKVCLKEARLKETDIILKQIKRVAERSEKFAAIGRLGAAVAHEIRTPLTSLKLFLESVQPEIEISADYTEDYRIAMQQIKRIEATINRFLDFSKPQELVFSEIDISQLIENVLVMIRPMVKKHECYLNIDMEKKLPKINGDKKSLEEALINLFVNSLEAMGVQGKLFVVVQTDFFRSNDKKVPGIRIDIGDTGYGISEDQIVNIFDPFFTTKSSGTGLGLPLVLNIIKRHGGDIQVKSHVNKGTLFSIYLPLKLDHFIIEPNLPHSDKNPDPDLP